MARAVFFLGRGPDARPLGSLYRVSPAEHTDAEPSPEALVALPIGRAVLAATHLDDYDDSYLPALHHPTTPITSAASSPALASTTPRGTCSSRRL